MREKWECRRHLFEAQETSHEEYGEGRAQTQWGVGFYPSSPSPSPDARRPDPSSVPGPLSHIRGWSAPSQRPLMPRSSVLRRARWPSLPRLACSKGYHRVTVARYYSQSRPLPRRHERLLAPFRVSALLLEHSMAGSPNFRRECADGYWAERKAYLIHGDSTSGGSGLVVTGANLAILTASIWFILANSPLPQGGLLFLLGITRSDMASLLPCDVFVLPSLS